MEANRSNLLFDAINQTLGQYRKLFATAKISSIKKTTKLVGKLENFVDGLSKKQPSFDEHEWISVFYHQVISSG